MTSWLIAGAILVLSPAVASGQTPASYTVSQARVGEATYQDVCASCHRHDLAGASDTPELAGAAFRGMWGGRPASDLFDYIKAAMPPAGRKPDDESLTAVVAYILRKNGMPSGSTPLEATAAGAIASAPDR